MGVHWKDWCWSWKSNPLATWCEELTHLKRPRCWERLKAGGGDDRGWDGWMASLTQWTWVWVNSGSCRCTERPGMLQSMVSQRVGHNWETGLNWAELKRDRKLGKYKYLLSLEKCILRSSVHFLIRLFVFLLLSSMSSVCKFWRLVSRSLHHLQIFSPILSVVFSFCLWFPLMCKLFWV